MIDEEKKKEQESQKPEQKTEQKPKKKSKCCCFILPGLLFCLLLFKIGQMFFFGGSADDKIPIPPSANDSKTSQNTTPSSDNQTKNNTDNSSQNDTSNQNNDQTPSAETTNNSSSDEGYTKEQYINYFVDAAVKYTDGSPSPLARFNKTINLKVIGAIPAQASADTLQRVIDDFNGISQNVKLERNDAGSDLQVFFIPISEFGNYTNSPGGHQGFSVTVPDSQCQFKYSKAYIANDPDIDQDTRDYIIRHEITHALGFSGHNEPTSGSIMGNRLKQDHYSALDRKLIQMLYNSGVPTCSNEAQVRSFFSNRDF